jgi:formyl-CoA transferase
MRPGTIERLGLGYEQVAEVNPRVVYCSISGFNLDGANRDKPAYDDIIQASSGLATLQAQLNEGPPTYVASAIADKIVGMFAFGVILAALRHRERSGAGQRIDIPMHDTIAAFLMVEHLYGSTFCPPLSPPGYPRCLTPSRRPYQTSDGFVAVVIYSDQNWLDFFRIIGRPELLTDPRFKTITARTEHIDELYALVADELRKRPTGVWLQLLEGANIPAVPVATLDDLISEQTEGESGLIGCVEHPSEGRILDVAFPARLSASPGQRADPAPRLGEQTDEILREAGLRSIEIDRLLECGAAARAEAAASPKDGRCEPESSNTPAIASIGRPEASS